MELPRLRLKLAITIPDILQNYLKRHMDLGQENIEIFMESNKDASITFVHKSKAAPGTGTYTI